MVELECKNVAFYSTRDEGAFFARAQSIPVVVNVSGRGRGIMLTVKSKRVPAVRLRDSTSFLNANREDMTWAEEVVGHRLRCGSVDL